MKAQHLFATLAAAAVLVSCSKTMEDYVDEISSLSNEAADIILNCHTKNDAIAAADKLHSIADELEEISEELNKNKAAIAESTLDMTVAELKVYEDQITNKQKETADKMRRAQEHISKNDAGKSAYLQYAIQRVCN